MSYTLNIEPDIVKEAERCARRDGTTVDAMIRACLLVFVSQRTKGDAVPFQHTKPTSDSCIRIGSMRDEINLPDDFDDVFEALDKDVEKMFTGGKS